MTGQTWGNRIEIRHRDCPLKVFALYIKGREVYPKEEADTLEADLQPLVDGTRITRLSRHDTNLANNPQMPERFESPKYSWFQQPEGARLLGRMSAQAGNTGHSKGRVNFSG